ncbi:MAG: TonB family protein [Clostridiales bacterium]|nr:TonB family protein [Clostridiales bacterium]
MKRKRIAKSLIFPIFLGLSVLFVIPPEVIGLQQVDPFYSTLFEKAQKAFLAKKYEDAARQFEIASFGLTANKTLRAKAYVYLGICHYHLKNLSRSEEFLSQASELIGEEGFDSLEIAESALPDLDKLLTLFNIRPAQQPVSAESQAQAQEKQEKPASPQENPGLPQKSPKTKAKEPAKAPQKELPKEEPITLDKIKEGDLIPLEMVESKPVATRRIQPKYPSEALRAGIEGKVLVNALISETGAVIKTEVIKGMKGALELDAAAQRAVAQWKFEPATIKGIKVKVWLPVAVEFKKQE